MSLKIYSTLSRQKEDFVPIVPFRIAVQAREARQKRDWTSQRLGRETEGRAVGWFSSASVMRYNHG